MHHDGETVDAPYDVLQTPPRLDHAVKAQQPLSAILLQAHHSCCFAGCFFYCLRQYETYCFFGCLETRRHPHDVSSCVCVARTCRHQPSLQLPEDPAIGVQPPLCLGFPPSLARCEPLSPHHPAPGCRRCPLEHPLTLVASGLGSQRHFHSGAEKEYRSGHHCQDARHLEEYVLSSPDLPCVALLAGQLGFLPCCVCGREACDCGDCVAHRGDCAGHALRCVCGHPPGDHGDAFHCCDDCHGHRFLSALHGPDQSSEAGQDRGP
mmetsp:Transcript_7014/g.12461  ORF Transcript_7014/g.12461 Transcript_7014/m.12461 type:complete len:264 (+) Transcript_7014:998-1789(+)